ncbi:MAG: hypothetical protein HRT45_13010 [Bdellovibrionales bacterium]|nr:hypothetical protein [Bdellovibrionales bacterium]
MKSTQVSIVAAILLFTSSAFAWRTVRFTAKATQQPTYNNAITAGRALAQEIDAGQNRKANSFMRFQNCEVRRGGKYIVINGMNIQEKFVYKDGDFVKVFEAVISYSNKRCEKDDD